MEVFSAWYSGNPYEDYAIWNRMTGPYGPFYGALVFCNILSIQSLWFKRLRTSTVAVFIVSIIVLFGMWLERFVIVITSLHRDYLPSSWGMYWPTRWDWATYFGTI